MSADPIYIPATGVHLTPETFKGLLARAWSQGFDAGEKDALGHVTFDEPCIQNPYKETQ